MKLSIIIPVYNSGEILNTLIESINLSLKNSKKINNYEIFLINDASRDNSWDKIKKISEINKNIKGINLLRNFGQHSATMAGLNFCSGEFIITMDDDLQHSPEFIEKIFDQLKDYDVCYTRYIKRQHITWKRLISWLNNIFASYLFDKPMKIYFSSFRGFKKKISLQIIKNKNPIVLIDALILKETKNICIIDVLHKKRFKGKSNYDFKKLFSLWFDMIFNFHVHPLRSATIIGLILKNFIKIFRFVLKNKEKKYQYLIKEKIF